MVADRSSVDLGISKKIDPDWKETLSLTLHCIVCIARLADRMLSFSFGWGGG